MNKLDEYLQLILNTDFPYKSYTLEQINKYYNNLKNLDDSYLAKVGLEIIENYHKSVWRCNIKNHQSPLEAWSNPEIMLKVIENRFKYLNTDILTPFQIRAGLSISKLAPRVSIFKPANAKYLIHKYLNEFYTIFDPCSGFSGRMLGTCCLDKMYIGQDINSITINESQQIINDLHLNATVSVKNSIYCTGSYDCLFTCPPYSDKEFWHQEIENLSADDWIEVCLKNYDCRKYLFVVDHTEKYKNCIVEKFVNKSHISKSVEYVILITNDR